MFIPFFYQTNLINLAEFKLNIQHIKQIHILIQHSVSVLEIKMGFVYCF